MKRPAASEDQGDDLGLASKRHRSSGRPANIRFILQSKNAGAIIGKGGANINRLRKDYKANVTVPDCPGPERILTVVADLDSAGEILLDIIPKLEVNPQNHSMNYECEMRMLIHQSHTGCVIGRGGQRIKELREKYGAKIKVFTSNCPNSTERVAQIIGSPDGVVNCIKEITDAINDAPVKGPSQLYDPHNYDTFYAAEYGGYEETGGRGMRGQGGHRGRGGGPPRSWGDDHVNDYEQFLPPEHGRGLAQGPRGGGGNRGMRGGGGGGMYGGYGQGGRQDRAQMAPPQMSNERNMWGSGGGGYEEESFGGAQSGGGAQEARGPLIGYPTGAMGNKGANGRGMEYSGGSDGGNWGNKQTFY